jgi:pyruvate formate lyase activating enzyme
MEIGGFLKNTLIDYPGKLAATIFTIGCNFECPFCYSTELVLPKKIKDQPRISVGEIMNFLKRRQGLIEGVVICGGEPTIYGEKLIDFVKSIKQLGFDVKVDTNGFLPDVLEKLLKQVDYIAMDIKAPKDRYKEFCGKDIDVSKIGRSINILKKSNIGYEFRTTVAPGLKKDDILKIADWISGSKKYFLQEFNFQKDIIDPKITLKPALSQMELKKITEEIKGKFNVCKVR